MRGCSRPVQLWRYETAAHGRRAVTNKSKRWQTAAAPLPTTVIMHPSSEKSPLLNRIGIPPLNTVPFPQIVTPAATPHSSYYPHSADSPRSPLSPPASILIEDRRYLPRPVTSSRNNSSWLRPLPALPQGLTFPAFIQASLSGAASLLGWDMVTGCILYAPNESLNVLPSIFPYPAPSQTTLGMTCATSTAYGLLLSITLTLISSLVYFRSQQRSKSPTLPGLESNGPSLKANFATFAMTPIACLLASMFTAVIVSTDLNANIGTVCHLGSALCTSVGIVAALLA